MVFRRMFEPIRMGDVLVRNRLAMASISNLFATSYGEVTSRTLDYYAARARGGVGLLIVEYANVEAAGKGAYAMLGCYADKLIPGLSLLSRTIKENGATAALQIAHAGRQTTLGITGTDRLKAPSPIALPIHGYPVPEEMSLDEIEKAIENFGEAALRVKKAGFDAVEVHGAHGYLAFGFLSPLQNQRKDAFGGSLENRMRFGIEVVKRMRKKVGQKFLVGYKLSAEEYLPGGVTLGETRVFAKELERAGLSWLQVSSGIYASTHHTVPPMYTTWNNAELAAEMKKILSIPVITVGGHGDPRAIEEILGEGKADMVALGRQLVCDPEYPNKAKDGRSESIRRCIRCNEGCNGYFFRGWPITCTINPEVGREKEYEIEPVRRRKKVLVVGGGPAGLEAGRVSALRGHDVTIWERSSRLGGQLNVASVPDFKQPLRIYLEYQINLVKEAGVKIELNREATVDSVKSFGADAVVVAVGAGPVKDAIPGCEEDFVFSAEDVLQKRKPVGAKALVVGGGLIGCEVGLFMAQQGKRVSIVEMQNQLMPGADLASKLAMEELLEKNGVSVLIGSRVKEVSKEGVILQNGGGEEVKEAAETVVLALGYSPHQTLYISLSREVKELYFIGDCREVRNLLGAVHDGAHVGRTV